MSSDIILSASDMRKLAELTVLLDTTINLKLWVEGVYQANWKKEATSYMWRSNTDSVEIVHNKDYDNKVSKLIGEPEGRALEFN